MPLALLIWDASLPWMVAAAALAVVMLLLIVLSYTRAAAPTRVKLLAGVLKVAGIAALLVCLLEPLFSGVRPRPGENLFVVLADNSRGLQIRDAANRPTRGERMKEELTRDSDWQTRLSQDFDVRRYTYDRRVHSVTEYDSLDFEGASSAMIASLSNVGQRFRGRPNAGVLLLTDGNATDGGEDALQWDSLPPVYPVVLGKERPPRDIRLSRIAVSQTNFEAAPVTILCEVEVDGFSEDVIVQLLDESGKELQRHTVNNTGDGRPLAHRLQLRPESPGVSFYRVRVAAESEANVFEDSQQTAEATLANNTRWAVVDRSGGPYRVLYVSGRPNWDFKFLRRAIQEDDEIDLLGLIRIAKREPKFTFRSREGESTNPLFRGFDNQEDEEAEQYDQPVLLRLGTKDENELRDGFPKAAKDLFEYHAVILDDVDTSYFTQDQMSLVQEFVSARGGGFLMLGGRESFHGGKYARTPIGELLPVYLDRFDETQSQLSYRLQLTRDGWLQPWIRLRNTEAGENKRLEEMPAFRTVNRVRSIKPGATVLAHVSGTDGEDYPALAVHRFGRGRAAAMLVADLWRWNLRREDHTTSDLEKAWRQTIRWLVADIPQRVEVDTRLNEDDPSMPILVSVQVRDELFQPLDNARVTMTVKTPADKQIELTADASSRKPGVYETTFVPRLPGIYRAEVVAVDEDDEELGRREAGWVAEPDTEEFQTLKPNRELLEQIAASTEGEVIDLDKLDDFVRGLPNRKIPVTEPWIYPLWHQWPVFLLAITCLVGEWGVRRWNGLP